VVSASACQQQSGEPTSTAEVERVVDGDTVIVHIGGERERVRLIGIDTPEIAHEGSSDRPGNPAECFGDEAMRYTESLLPVGSEVRLERDVVPRDDYGRLLAYVYRLSDDLFVNMAIVRDGFAQPLTIPPNDTFASQFVEAARDAERESVGLWARCGDDVSQ
jgi:micrococcal nuclease